VPKQDRFLGPAEDWGAVELGWQGLEIGQERGGGG
jgi:hypothetical protein